MKRSILFALASLLTFSAFSQEKIDTLYYDRDGHGVSHKEFADYYRIAIYSNDQNRANKYRTFHMNGEVMSSGEFISLDRDDDRNSKFIGTVVIYDKNGNPSAVRNYSNGLLDGLSEEYLNDGTIIQEEFKAGKPAKDYYTKSDRDGNLIKIRYSDNSIIWDSPLQSEMTEDYHEGNKWSYYSKNGVTVALHTGKISDYGKYHVLNITISNNSLVPIEFEPSSNITAESINYKKNEKTPLKVYSCEEYLRKYDKRTAWGAAIFGISEALTLLDGGFSEEKSVSVNNKGERTVTYTKKYDPFDHFIEWKMAHMEARDYDNSVIDGREVRRVGYFKRSTIYPGEDVSGFAYVERIKGNEVTVNIDIEGAIYTFTWEFKK